MKGFLFDFDAPPIADLGAKFRVIAAVSNQPVALCLSPDYLRQIAARLDRAGQLEADVAGLRAQITALTDDGIRLRHRCAHFVLWAFWSSVLGIVAYFALLIGFWA